jgi:pimeloyl-ACP methyl ester carboxylesterase
MMARMATPRASVRVRRRWLLPAIALAVIAFAAGGFVAWTRAARYDAFAEAVAIADAGRQVRGWTVFEPAGEPVAGFVFYPGGLVDARAYAPLLKRVAEAGVLTVLVPMPLDLAVFGLDRAAEVIAAFPNVGTWAIGGHSLGGAMAAEFVKRFPNAVAGLALLASYPAASTDLSAWPGRAVTLLGDADGLTSRADVDGSLARLPPRTGRRAAMGWRASIGTPSRRGRRRRCCS